MPPRPPRPGPPPLDLKHFLLRSEALHLYRSFLRVAARAPGGPNAAAGGGSSPRAELVATIRAEFERARANGSSGSQGGGSEKGGKKEKGASATSTQAIKHALADGKLQLKRLEEMLGMQR